VLATGGEFNVTGTLLISAHTWLARSTAPAWNAACRQSWVSNTRS